MVQQGVLAENGSMGLSGSGCCVTLVVGIFAIVFVVTALAVALSLYPNVILEGCILFVDLGLLLGILLASLLDFLR